MKKIAAIMSLAIALGVCVNTPAAEAKKIVLVAGTPSWASDPGAHEFNAGVVLLKQCLDRVPGVAAVVFTNGWPAAGNAFDGAAAVVLYTCGGSTNPAFEGNHLAQLKDAMKRGTGFAYFHHATEVPSRTNVADFLDLMGGCFEPQKSVKGFWDADFKELPTHAITRGVKPFKLNDEWYHHLTFQAKGVTPILSAIPPENGAPGTVAQVVAWAYERPDGGRSFGTSGGHYHKNWGDDNFRKLVLNGLLWIAKVEVLADGVASTVSAADLTVNLRGPKP